MVEYEKNMDFIVGYDHFGFSNCMRRGQRAGWRFNLSTGDSWNRKHTGEICF